VRDGREPTHMAAIPPFYFSTLENSLGHSMTALHESLGVTQSCKNPRKFSVTDGDGGEVRGDAYVSRARREVRECIIRVFGRGLQLELLANGA
jgi:hypothetical protein